MSSNVGKLYVVATPIGNLGDLSSRAQEVLSQVTLVAAEDTRHSQGLFNHLGLSPTFISYHDHNDHERTARLIEKLCQGEHVALISDAGTPLISDPGFLLVLKAHEAGIPVIPIPGPCSIIAALSVAGLPTDKFLFEGFLPAKAQARQNRLSELVDFPHTLVLFEAPHRLLALMVDLSEIFGPDRKITIVREITKKFESIYIGTIKDNLEKAHNGKIPLKGELVVIIGGAPKKVELSSQAQEMKRVLDILMRELPLKQAVKIASKLTNIPKNTLYDFATHLRDNAKGEGQMDEE